MTQGNERNVQLAIQIMLRNRDAGRRLYMCLWQSQDNEVDDEFIPARTESEVTCGMAACLGGYMALAPEFYDQGLRLLVDGCPYIIVDGVTHRGYGAVAFLLGIENLRAKRLCYMGPSGHELYGKFAEDVTFDDVIGQLALLIEQR